MKESVPLGDAVLDALRRIEDKLDALIAALADDEEVQVTTSLDGAVVGAERDDTQPL